MKHIGVLVVVLVLGISAIIIGFNSSNLQLPSNAAKNQVQPANLGLNIETTTNTNGLTKVKTSWDKQSGNVLFYNIKILKADGSRVAKADPKNIGLETSKTFGDEPLETGLYNVFVKAFYPDKILEEVQPFTVINPLNQNLITMVKNPGFESVKPVDPAKPKDFDPTDWLTAEGIFEIKTLPNGAVDETGIEKVEMPRLIQVVGPDGQVNPRQTMMGKVNPTEGNKAHFKYLYNPPVTNTDGGTFIQRLAVFVPEQDKYSQRLEIRKLAGGEHLRVFWQKNISPSRNGSQRAITAPVTEVCMRGPAPTGDPGGGKQGYCVDLPGIETNKWNQYEFKFEKLPEPDQWKFTMSLNGNVIMKTGKNGVPPIWITEKIGLLFLGDECQGSSACYDGLGTFYYDNADAFYIKP